MPSSGRASAYSRNRIRYRYRSASRPSSLARSPGSSTSPGRQAVGADPVEDLVGDDLHRLAQALAELGGHPDGVLAGLVHPVGELLAAALGGRLQDVGAEQGGDRLELGLVGAVDRGVQADREVPALGPGEAVGEDDHAAVQQQHVPGRLVGVEQPADQLGAGRDPLVAPGLDRVQEPPGPVGVERGVGVGGPAAVDRDHVLPLVRDRHAERLTRSPDVHDTARSGETEGAEHIVVLLLDGLVVGAALVLGDRVAVGGALGEIGEVGAGGEVAALERPEFPDRARIPLLVPLRPLGAQAVLLGQLAGQDLGEVVRGQVVAAVGQRVVAHRAPSSTARMRSSGSPAVCSFVIMSSSSPAVVSTCCSRRARNWGRTSSRLSCRHALTRSRYSFSGSSTLRS